MPAVASVAESERPGLIDPKREATIRLTAVISEEVLLTLAF